MATKGFTKINNSIIFDMNLSLEAIGLYTKLQYLSTIENFCIKRNHIKSISGYGETAFRRVWKELKDKKILVEIKDRVKGRYVYTYTLKNNEDITKPKAPVEEKKPKHVDSDKNIILDGQIDIDEVSGEEQKEVPVIDKSVAVVAEATGFTNTEASELLVVAENNVTKVMESYVYVKSQNNIKNLFNYTKWAITNKIKVQNINSGKSGKVSLFNNFEQRDYDFKELENALLYGDPYELPA